MKKVALCVTCLVDQVLPEIGVASVKLLRRAGYEVEYPEAQTCCGQPFFNSGFRDQATDLAKRTIEIFEPYDAVVLPSGSCASMVIKEHAHLFDDSAEWKARATGLADKTSELSRLLVEAEWTPEDSGVGMTVTYHDSCHANRMLGIGQEPRTLLEQSGCRVVEMMEPDRCCGFGGLFSIKMPEVSNAMTTEKLRQATETEVDALVTVDPGCLIQMRGLRKGQGPEIRHFAEVLEERTR